MDLTVPMCEGCDCVRVSVGHQVVRSGTSEAAFRGFNEDYTHTHVQCVPGIKAHTKINSNKQMHKCHRFTPVRSVSA